MARPSGVWRRSRSTLSRARSRAATRRLTVTPAPTKKASATTCPSVLTKGATSQARVMRSAWLVAPSVSLEGHVVALAFFVGAGVTVSLLVAARDRARESVDLLLRHTPLGLAIHDADFRYVRVNHALAEMNGLAPGAHRGRTVREVLGDAAADQLEPLLQRVHTTRRPVTVDSLRVPLSDGPSEQGERYFSLIYSPILDARGRVTGT